MKWLVPHLLLLAAFVALVPCAAAQTVTLPTSDDPVGDVVDTIAGDVTDVTQAVSVAGLGTDVGGTLSTVEQTGTDVLETGTAAGGTFDPATSSSGSSSGTTGGGPRASSHEQARGRTSPGKGFRSRFDRLPARLERLLERIELGRNVRANLRRLEQALAGLSARERARVLRLLNAEIRRLRAGGVSPAEERRIARLLRAREAMTSPRTTPPIPAVADQSTRIATARSSLAGGVLATAGAGRAAPPPADTARTLTEGGSTEPSRILEAGRFPLKIALALGAVLLVILGGLAVREEWPGLR